MNLRQIEKFVFLLTVMGLFVPLGVNTGIIILYVWNIPAVILLFISLTKVRFEKRRKIRKWDTWDASIIGLIFFLLFFTLLGENLSVNIAFLMQFATILFLGFYARRAWQKIVTPQMLITTATIGILIQAGIGVLQQITLSQIGNPSAYFGGDQSANLKDNLDTQISRVQGTVGQANVVANWIITLFPFAYISPYIRGIKNSKIIRTIAIFLGVIGIFLTISRANIVIFIFLVLVFSIPYMKHFKKARWTYNLLIQRLSGTFIICTLAGIWLFSNIDLVNRYYNIIESRFDLITKVADSNAAKGSLVATGGFRYEMNKGALQKIGENPLWGQGYQNSKYIWTSVDTDIPSWWTYRPHNVYLSLGVDGGLLAIFFYGIITCLPIYLLIFRVKHNHALKYAFLFALCAGFLFSQIYLTTLSAEYGALYSLVLGCSMGYIDKQRNYGGPSTFNPLKREK